VTSLKAILAIIIATLFFSLTACTAEIGSERWCQQMKDKSKGDWTMSETGDYTKHCVFK